MPTCLPAPAGVVNGIDYSEWNPSSDPHLQSGAPRDGVHATAWLYRWRGTTALLHSSCRAGEHSTEAAARQAALALAGLRPGCWAKLAGGGAPALIRASPPPAAYVMSPVTPMRLKEKCPVCLPPSLACAPVLTCCRALLPGTDGYVNYDTDTLDKKRQCKMALQKASAAGPAGRGECVAVWRERAGALKAGLECRALTAEER